LNCFYHGSNFPINQLDISFFPHIHSALSDDDDLTMMEK